MRSFIALSLPEPVLDELSRLQDMIPVGRPVPLDNLHLTLAFLGEVDGADLNALDQALDRPHPGPLRVRITGLDSFTERKHGLIFAAVAPDAPLTDLHDRVMRAARQAGLALPRRRFRPHVTLTRARQPPRGPARDRLAAMLGPVPLSPFDATEMALYRSNLHPDGARHEILATYPLGA